MPCNKFRDTFTTRDFLRKTRQNYQVFLAVLFQDELIQMGLHRTLSLQFLKQGSITLRQAARLADVSIEEMMTLCAGFDISLVDYSVVDLEEELKLV